MSAQVATPLPDLAATEARHRALDRQRAVGRLTAPLCVPLAVLIMRWGFRWRVRAVSKGGDKGTWSEFRRLYMY